MRSYIIRRILLTVPTVLIVSLIIFFTIRFLPGNVIDKMVGMAGGEFEETRAAIEHSLGMDVPIHIQYVKWLGNIVLHGDLGNSLWTDTPVLDMIVSKFPVTFELGILSIIIALIIALPIGIFSALRQDNWGDYIARSFAILCISIPGFWLGTLVMVLPSLWWGWSPAITLITFTEDPIGNLQMFIIPAIILGMSMSGVTMRMTRTMMLEVLRQDYIRTAWSKGLKERVVILRHAMKNALIPVISIVGLQIPIVIGGSVIIEQIFCLPGLGRLILDAVTYRDYSIISGFMLFIGFGIMFINLMVDLTYGFFDPRIHYR